MFFKTIEFDYCARESTNEDIVLKKVEFNIFFYTIK